MVTIPTAPNGPTVYVVREQPAAAPFREIIGIALKALKAGPCGIENLQIGANLGAADRNHRDDVR